MQWNLNNHTTQRLGQNNNAAHSPFGGRPSTTAQNTLGADGDMTMQDDLSKPLTTDRTTGGGLFRSHHVSMLQQPQNGQQREFVVDGMPSSRSKLFRARKPDQDKFGGTHMHLGALRQTQPVLQGATAGLSPSQPKPSMALNFTPIAPKMSRIRNLAGLGNDRATPTPGTGIDLHQDEADTELLGGQVDGDNSVMPPRNPTLQASILQKHRLHTKEMEEEKHAQSMLASQQETFGQQSRFGGGAAGDDTDVAARARRMNANAMSTFATSHEDIKLAIRAVRDKMEVQFAKSVDYNLVDLANQTVNQGDQMPQADYKPLAFIPSMQIKLPQPVLEEIQRSGMRSEPGNAADQQQQQQSSVVTAMSKRHPIVYFGIGNRLYVWDYLRVQQKVQKTGQNQLHQTVPRADARDETVAENNNMLCDYVFNDKINCILELNSVNRYSNWQQACQATSECRYVLVATMREIQLLAVKRDPIYGQLMVQETNLAPLDQGLTHVMIECSKTGRVFFGREGGRVSELLFQNTECERLNKSRVSRIASSVLGQRKRLYRVHHQKETLALSFIPGWVKSIAKESHTKQILQLQIDEQRNILYSRSQSASGPTSGQCVIEIFDLGFYGNEFKPQTTIQMWELAVAIHKMYGRQLDRRCSKYELAEVYDVVDIQPVQYAESKEHNLILTTRNCERVYMRLATQARRIDDEVQALKTLEDTGLQSDFLIQEEVVPGAWEIVSILQNYPEDSFVLGNKVFAEQILRAPFAEHYMPERSNRNRTMLDTRQPKFTHYDRNQSLLVFQTYEIDEQQAGGQETLKLSFISKNTAMYNHIRQQDYQSDRSMDVREEFSVLQLSGSQISLPWQKSQNQNRTDSETLLQLEGAKSSAQSTGNLVTMGTLKVQKQFPTWGDHSYVLPYLPGCESEQQVYLNGGKMSMLTSHRLVEISQLRPIDHLYSILFAMQEMNRSQVFYYDNFMDFATKYTMQEACTMLVQILADTQGTYTTSTRLSHLLNMKRAIINRESRKHPLHQTGASSLYDQRRPGTTSLPRKNRQSPKQVAQGGGRTFYGNLCNNDDNSNFRSMAADQRNGLNQMRQHPESINMPSVLHEFDLDNLNREVDQKRVNKQLAQLALDLLTQFGDSINPNQRQIIRDRIENPAEQQTSQSQAANSLQLYSNKHKAVYLYTYRVIRPIWQMNITSYVSASALDRQTFNLDMMMPVKEKLDNIQQFITRHERAIVGLTCQNRELIPRNHELVHDACLVKNLELEISEHIQVEEKKSLVHLKVFVQRCLDVIEFLYFIEQEIENSRRKFIDLIRELGPSLKDALSKHKFLDFVLSDSNDLIRQMLQKTIYLQSTDDGQLSQQTLQLKQQRVSQLCPTLFSRLESTIFLGHSMVQTAGFETDPMRKDELVAKAIDNLLVDPSQIELAEVIPVLVKNKQFQQLVHICLKKIQFRHGSSDQESILEIRDLLELIVKIVEVVDLAIVAPEDSKAMMAFDSSGYTQNFASAMQSLNIEQKLILRNNLVAQLANQSEVPEAINQVLQTFMFKNKDIDFICQKVSPQDIKKQCQIFVSEQSKSGCFTQKQFNNVFRILSKARQVADLASIVKAVLLQQVVLLEESGVASVDPAASNLIECKLTCSYRLKLTRQTIQLLEDSSRPIPGFNGRNAPFDARNPRNNSVMTDTNALVFESTIQLQSELKEIAANLSVQVDAIKSVEAKLKLREIYNRGRNNNNLDRESQELEAVKIRELNEVREELEYSLLNEQDLHKLYQKHELHDRNVQLLFGIQINSVDQEKKLEQHQRDGLARLVDSLKLLCGGNQSDFISNFKSQIRTIFTTDVLKVAAKKQLLFFVADMVNDSNCCVQNLAKGDKIWVQDFLLRDLKILPSELLRYYQKIKKQENNRQCFEYSLALIRLWVKILNDMNENSDLKTELYRDLLAHGTSLFQEVVINFCESFIKSDENKLSMPLNEQNDCQRLYQDAHKEIMDLLERNIPSFKSDQIAKYAQAQPVIRPQQPNQRSGPIVLSKSAVVKPPEPVVQEEDKNTEVEDQQRKRKRQHQANRSFRSSGSLSRQPNQSQQHSQMSAVPIEDSYQQAGVPKLKQGRAEDDKGSQLLNDQSPNQGSQQQQPSLKRMREQSLQQNQNN